MSSLLAFLLVKIASGYFPDRILSVLAIFKPWQ